MGKSPGKWIKTVLFGKKSSKSSMSKDEVKILSDEEAENPFVVSEQDPHELETANLSSNLPQNGIFSLSGTDGAQREGTLELISLDSEEIVVLEQAAIKAQAAFRGYLARRAFQALKGIIMLQALIRRDLVRRQTCNSDMLCTQEQLISHQTELVPEQPQNEIQKIRRNSRKVSGFRTEATRQKASLKKVSSPPVHDVPQKAVHNSSEKKSAAVVSVLKVSKQPEIQTTPNSYTAEEKHDMEDGNHLDDKLHPPENGQEEDQTNKENQRTSRRRLSFPVKLESGENGSQNSPTFPSYMAVTESAKARLRSQAGSPKFRQDGVENNGFYRQNSSPSSGNGRSSSMSSRMQNSRSEKSSRNSHEKVAQPDWKR
ncbi:protein IQ-DOMAIN 31-like isoform X2 [Pistacia vera]|uniref:protein IQ-DOMAIN 31-like isoform X2 n=1 Tax=Pistacia vera TaxID=55513 RepID=UPI001263853B|nr:protein IQ-DOMAIN 31-like isoform X2 [Pistacia vera]